MDFNLTQEQTQFAETVRRWVEKDYRFEQRSAIIASPEGVSSAAWRALTELGATALPIPEEQGGFDGTALDMMVVMQELGRGLVIEPYLATMLGAEFLKRAKAHFDIQEAVAAGSVRLAVALGERQSRHDLFDIACTASANADGYLLKGSKTVVIHGAQADYLIVSARTDGERRDQTGIALFLLDAKAAGVTRTDYRTIDGQRAADIVFEHVQVAPIARLGHDDGGWELLEAVADYGISLLCAEAIGLMEAISAATLDYLKTRQQFGVPIGKFQVLQHRMAEMFMELEQARSLATLAAVKVSSTDVEERRRTISAAKVRVALAARYVGQQAVQLHGGMGVTNELPVSHMFKRLTMIAMSCGDADHHLARFVAQPGFKNAA
ncbi:MULTISPECIES: acyl-CoA dehydrogenase [unclassified Undibacterium]|uniref:acyl-CoA dehydrogenase family protein n=1 Tax=unclassified Undibacterium TaxID=2630295 RepID=UPI002AC97BCF|nr:MULTISPECIES: acyl-CoA dehydrogenase [unclassified Undibacterium]MEB0139115.1 acyl-CoA dehydrogenase [Undibacterium sp. CCC2.1]MEB0173332.1 acyl-CoA dehydrogenase [Undibacterium sp. CCC1.1]MEB0177628.1 acyl-CoA dehydrogenase [Undibacterium sp. CCC3.4]MEB0216808.1 acyl-CoA dehydrogenase [Undibacterium sp. 5I2]WPX43110.1 acyl-CoA dehydrogenase [Undibacterium sp. CCC3.4]